ncbi:MAG: hypothetical protein QMD53_01885 [Actinomycetota bacterium]|nr:hypothetical protein [Actinomycetota bacterium]
MFALISLLAAALGGAPKAAAEAKPKVIMVITNGLGASELAEAAAPNLSKIAKEGAAGLMNVRTQAGPNPYDGYLCIGVGAKTKTGGTAGESFNRDEVHPSGILASDIFLQRTGIEPPLGSIANLSIANIIATSKTIPRSNLPGSLGKALKEGGLKAALIGNGDNVGEPHREASLITMDELGLTYLGDVSAATNTISKETGTITDYAALFTKTKDLLATSDLLVVELGDTTRLESRNNLYTEEAIIKRRKFKMEAVDRYLGEVLSILGDDTTLMLLAPSNPPEAMERGNFLAPAIMIGASVDGGLLISDTTRWPGIVDSTDIAPTILSILGAEKGEEMTGRPIRFLDRRVDPSYMGRMSTRYENKAIARVPLLKGYVTLVSIMVILAALVSFFKNIPKRLVGAIQVIFLWLLSIPVAFEIFAPIDYGHMILPILLVSAIAGAIVMCARYFKGSQLMPIVLICLLTVVILTLDMMTGWNLIRTSILGYCPNIGARFYGIGNEYMGILIGASIIGITSLLDVKKLRLRAHHLLAGLMFAAVVVAIGHPALGANVGGTIAASVGFAITLIVLFQGSLKRRHFLYVAGAALGALLIFLAIDIFRGGATSHAGRSVMMIYEGGVKELLEITRRKIAMNYRGMKYTVWTRILLATLLVSPMLFFRPVGFFDKLKRERPSLVAGFIGTSSGALAAFIFNDTGAAAAAATIMFAIVALLYIIVEEER